MAIDWDDDGVVIAALMTIYEKQTADEQVSGSTRWENGVGFNGRDAQFGTSLAQQYMRFGRLSPKQISAARRMLQKYRRQLPEELEPLPTNRPKKVKKPAEKHVKTLEGKLVVSFDYDRALVTAIKELPGRRFDRETKSWTLPDLPANRRRLRELGFPVPEETKEEVKLDLSGMRTNLYPYQVEGVRFIEEHNGRALIGDEMGLGKTIQSIAWLQMHPEARPAVIICPSSVKLNWQRELQMHAGLESTVLSGMEPQELSGEGIYIINYRILKAWKTAIEKIQPKVFILDEVHYCKNPDAQRTQVVQELVGGVKHLITLTGTPMVNRPVELFTPLNMLAPKIFDSFTTFAFRYCGASHNGYGYSFDGASNLAELHENLSDIMIRRKKSDVLKDLPEKTRATVPVSMSEMSQYEDSMEELLDLLGQAQWKHHQALALLNSMRRIIGISKVPAVIEWIRDYLESGKPLVVFAHHKDVIRLIYDAFKDVACKPLTGDTNAEERAEIVDCFQRGEKQLFIGNIQAAGTGITLTAADAVCFVELAWSPGTLTQAEDRIHRIGQENRCTAYYLVAPGTIDNKMASIIHRKQQVIDAAIDGQAEAEATCFDELIKSIIEENQ